ncbi:MAG: vitamin B12 dependent-methionine synthase activation domain-containing protein [Parafannyhessea sp.]|uniref:vitamin B12 dependent-methionine synthase activation domain-containing protein n=1 Tax=Parafannyhessea sp. TaxID=2847324 RepID=UPI003F02EDDE
MPVVPILKSYQIDSIDRKEVLRYLGYRGQEVTPELDARLDGAIARCLSIGQPRASLATFDVAGQEELPDGTPQVDLEGTALTLRGKSMRKHMDGAVRVGVFAVTIGMGVERELKRLSLTDNLGQVLFDAAATTMVERAADAAEATLVGIAARDGLYTNFRFSPGYGDMPMDTQPILLDTLDARRRLGITLSPTLLMTPTKSVTAVLGMFKTPQKSTHASCADCFCRAFCNLRATTGRTCHD